MGGKGLTLHGNHMLADNSYKMFSHIWKHKTELENCMLEILGGALSLNLQA